MVVFLWYSKTSLFIDIKMKKACCGQHEWTYDIGSGAQDEAKLIVGYTANEMQELKDAESPLFEARLNDIKCRSYLFKLKVSEETWNDEQRIRINVSRWVPSKDTTLELGPFSYALLSLW